MTTWIKQKLGGVIDINTRTVNNSFPYKRIQYVDISSVGTGRLESWTEFELSKAPSRAKRLVQKNDTVISTVRPNRRSFFYVKDVPDNLVVSTGFAVLTPKNINPKFLYSLITSQELTDYFTNNAKGAAYPAIDEDTISRAEVFLPELNIQEKIATVLSNYDDLIENNEKRIKILEEMAQRLYTEWFVKFKFPGYEKVKMVDSGTEYGMIPEGWEVTTLGKVAQVVRGCSYSTDEIDDVLGDYYLVNLKSFNRGGGFRFDGEKYFSGSINNNQSLRSGDIVVAVTDMTTDRAVIARPARIPEIEGKITLSADVVKINSDILPNSYTYQLLSSYRFTETTKQMANGANVLHLKPSAILEFVTVIPDAPLLNSFNVLCDPIAHEIDKLLKQNDNLSKIRDLLIPQLVTGRKELKQI